MAVVDTWVLDAKPGRDIRESFSLEAWRWFRENEDDVIKRFWILTVRVRDLRPLWEKLFGREKF